jgi:Mce-associated membrane protein
VVGDVSSALGKVFSYTPTQTAVTKQAARELLAGKAARQYAELFGQVEKRAAEQNLTLTTHVVRAGVTRLTDRSAHLLVFLDQVAERRGKAPVTAAAQLSVTAELHNGRWQIVGITSR